MDVVLLAVSIYALALLVSLLVVAIISLIRRFTREREPRKEANLDVVIAASLAAYGAETKPSVKAQERTAGGKAGFW